MNDIIADLLTARRIFRQGGSLMDAAIETGMGRNELDILLWRYAGRLNQLPTRPRTVAFVAANEVRA
jgi:hypothetical protein